MASVGFIALGECYGKIQDGVLMIGALDGMHGKLSKDFLDQLKSIGFQVGRDFARIEIPYNSPEKIEAPEDASHMFSDPNIISMDLSGLDTHNVTNMQGMFEGCENLTELDVSKFSTNNVINMNRMFEGCESLTELDLSSFSTSNVSEMYHMFNNCSNLEKLDISNIDIDRSIYELADDPLEIDFESDISIPRIHMFDNNDKLKEVTIPEGLRDGIDILREINMLKENWDINITFDHDTPLMLTVGDLNKARKNEIFQELESKTDCRILTALDVVRQVENHFGKEAERDFASTLWKNLYDLHRNDLIDHNEAYKAIQNSIKEYSEFGRFEEQPSADLTTQSELVHSFNHHDLPIPKQLDTMMKYAAMVTQGMEYRDIAEFCDRFAENYNTKTVAYLLENNIPTMEALSLSSIEREQAQKTISEGKIHDLAYVACTIEQNHSLTAMEKHDLLNVMAENVDKDNKEYEHAARFVPEMTHERLDEIRKGEDLSWNLMQTYQIREAGRDDLNRIVKENPTLKLDNGGIDLPQCKVENEKYIAEIYGHTDTRRALMIENLDDVHDEQLMALQEPHAGVFAISQKQHLAFPEITALVYEKDNGNTLIMKELSGSWSHSDEQKCMEIMGSWLLHNNYDNIINLVYEYNDYRADINIKQEIVYKNEALIPDSRQTYDLQSFDSLQYLKKDGIPAPELMTPELLSKELSALQEKYTAHQYSHGKEVEDCLVFDDEGLKNDPVFQTIQQVASEMTGQNFRGEHQDIQEMVNALDRETHEKDYRDDDIR